MASVGNIEDNNGVSISEAGLSKAFYAIPEENYGQRGLGEECQAVSVKTIFASLVTAEAVVSGNINNNEEVRLSKALLPAPEKT